MRPWLESDVIEALATLAQNDDSDDNAQLVRCKKVDRVRAFIHAEGLAAVLEILRDGTDFARDLNASAGMKQEAIQCRHLSMALTQAAKES